MAENTDENYFSNTALTPLSQEFKRKTELELSFLLEEDSILDTGFNFGVELADITGDEQFLQLTGDLANSEFAENLASETRSSRSKDDGTLKDKNIFVLGRETEAVHQRGAGKIKVVNDSVNKMSTTTQTAGQGDPTATVVTSAPSTTTTTTVTGTSGVTTTTTVGAGGNTSTTASSSQGQQPPQGSMAILDMTALVGALHGLQAAKEKTVHLKDLPTFAGQSHESAEEFLLKYENCATVHGWGDADKQKYMALACEKSALRWHEANKANFASFSDLKKEFLSTFGKNIFDLDLQGYTRRHAAQEDPLAYVFETLEFIRMSNPQASDIEKVQRLFDGLPASLKAEFVRNGPQNVADFTKRLKDVLREKQYAAKALTYNIGETVLSSAANSDLVEAIVKRLAPEKKNLVSYEEKTTVKPVYFLENEELEARLKRIEENPVLQNNPESSGNRNYQGRRNQGGAGFQQPQQGGTRPRGAGGTCRFCGRAGHFARDCRAKVGLNGQPNRNLRGGAFSGPRMGTPYGGYSQNFGQYQQGNQPYNQGMQPYQQGPQQVGQLSGFRPPMLTGPPSGQQFGPRPTQQFLALPQHASNPGVGGEQANPVWVDPSLGTQFSGGQDTWQGGVPGFQPLN